MNTKGIFSHKTDEWETPSGFFKDLDAEFHFTLDPCATEQNRKCEKFFTVKENGLKMAWGGVCGFLQSAVLTVLRMGEKVLRRVAEWRNGSNACAVKNRHEMVSRVGVWQGRNKVYPRAAKVWQRENRCAVPLNACHLQTAGKREGT